MRRRPRTGRVQHLHRAVGGCQALQPAAMHRPDDEQVGVLGVGDAPQRMRGRDVHLDQRLGGRCKLVTDAQQLALERRVRLACAAASGSDGSDATPTSTSRAPVALAIACASTAAARPRCPSDPTTMV